MKRARQGFTLVEVMITVAIAAILLALAAPNYSLWIKNSQVKTAAESIFNGLQLARAEAVRRNTRIFFSLTSTTGNDCVLDTTKSNWVISASEPDGACGAAPVSEAISFDDNPDPRIIQVRSAAESSLTVVLAAGQAEFPFNGLGRLAVVPATNPVIIDVTNPSAGACKSASGPVRCLRVTVSLGGQVRVCDPALIAPDPQAC